MKTTETKFKTGDKVSGVFYGKARTGHVIRHRASIVWVKWDDNPDKIAWCHPESLQTP